jgi:hypothetical protein
MLNQIRYQQQFQQIQSSPKPRTGNVATYVDRDSITGQRTITTADGSRYLAQYISNSQLSGTIALARSGTVGLPGYISQKPA